MKDSETVKLYVFSLILLPVILKGDSGANDPIQTHEFAYIRGEKIENDVMYQTKARSRLECASICGKDSDCSAANYQKSTCQIFTSVKIEDDLRLEDDKWMVLFKKEKKPDLSGKLGYSENTAAESCQAILSSDPDSKDGQYWLLLDSTPAQFFCDMTTDAGGWTLVYSYTVLDFNISPKERVFPSATWIMNPGFITAESASDPPTSETDFKAINFTLWHTFGDSILFKSNLMNWIKCIDIQQPIYDRTDGDISCSIVKRLDETVCADVPGSWVSKNEFPILKSTSGVMINFDCTDLGYRATHESCPTSPTQKTMPDPHGSVYIR